MSIRSRIDPGGAAAPIPYMSYIPRSKTSKEKISAPPKYLLSIQCQTGCATIQLHCGYKSDHWLLKEITLSFFTP